MRYLSPFVTHGTHMLKMEQIEKAAEDYKHIITGLREGSFSEEELMKKEYINDIIS
jgi:glutathione-regulated potassium-efflux system ancillary protein KefG